MFLTWKKAVAAAVLACVVSVSVAQAPPEPPKIITSVPSAGEINVDPGLTTVSVTFDRLMSAGMSWTGGPPLMPPMPEGARPVWRDRRTAELPVKLEPGKMYRVGINATDYKNFRSSGGLPVTPTALVFTTRGSSETAVQQMKAPQVAKFDPPQGAQDVAAGETTVTVTFDQPMDSGFTLVESGPSFPDLVTRPVWNENRTALSVGVRLLPGESYQMGLNGAADRNLMSRFGVPLETTVYRFRTKGSRAGE